MRKYMVMYPCGFPHTQTCSVFARFCRILHIKSWHSILFAEDFRRWLHKLNIIDHLRNFPIDNAQKQPGIVEGNFFLFAQ